MQILYGAGITSAVFQYGRKGGPTLKNIVELVVKKRTRKEARNYYGIADRSVELEFLGNETFIGYFNLLFSDKLGETLIERFMQLCARMNRGQIADFIRRLPEEMINELSTDAEFQNICKTVSGGNIPFSVEAPKKVAKGSSRITHKGSSKGNETAPAPEDDLPVNVNRKRVIGNILICMGIGLAFVLILIGVYVSGIIPYFLGII